MVAPSKRLNWLWPVKYHLYLISPLPSLCLISPLSLQDFSNSTSKFSSVPMGQVGDVKLWQMFLPSELQNVQRIFCSLRSSNKASVTSHNGLSVRDWLRYFYDLDGAALLILRKESDTQKLVFCLNRITGPLPALILLVFC